MLIDPLL